MTVLMYDSDRPSAIPATAVMVAGYCDGSNPWSAADWARFPNATKVRISRRDSSDDGDVLDVESGFLTWPPGPKTVAWVQRRRQRGIDPAIYCNQINGWPILRNLFHNAGIAPPKWWVSRYLTADITRIVIPEGAVGVQFADPKLHGQGHFDLSLMDGTWPRKDSTMVDDSLASQQAWRVHAMIHLLEHVDEHAPFNAGEIVEFSNYILAINDRIVRIESMMGQLQVGGIDYALLAKAVNDDAANRLKE